MPKDGLTLHEAMIVVMVRRRRYSMTSAELSEQNEALSLKPQDNGDWPDAVQMFLRAREYPDFFEVSGDAKECTIRLRRIGDAPAVSS
jgi:hypothetical protein